MQKLGDVNLNRLAVFAAVVEAGSLSAAARQLGLAKTMVSTHLQRLEAELGVSLLLRTTRRQSLTQAGEDFYQASRRIVRDAQAAITAAGESNAEPRGTLRVTAPIDYAATVVAPVAVALRRRYPALRIELLGGDRVVDLLAEGIDVAVRAGRLADSGLQATRVGSFGEWLVAAPHFFDNVAVPQTPEAVAPLPFIALSALQQPLAWNFIGTGSVRRRKALRFEASFWANTADAVRSAALAGGGLAVLPDYAVAADVEAGRLLRLLPDWRLPESGIYAVFPAARHPPRKIRAFIDMLRQHIDPQRGAALP